MQMPVGAIKPIDGSGVVDREVSKDDVSRNIAVWLQMWSDR